jgi:predicted nucleotidyltransferase
MKVDWTKTIEGVPMKIVQALMRDLRRWSHTRNEIAEATCLALIKVGRVSLFPDRDMPRLTWGSDFILGCVSRGSLRVVIADKVWSPTKIRRVARAMTDALLAEGLLRPCQKEADHYEASYAGIGLAVARNLKRIDRAQAESFVTELLARTDAINSDANSAYRVAAIWVYGSYVKGGPDLGDVDLLISLRRNREIEIIGDDDAHRRAEQQVKKRLKINRYLHINFNYFDPDDFGEMKPVEQIYPRTA